MPVVGHGGEGGWGGRGYLWFPCYHAAVGLVGLVSAHHASNTLAHSVAWRPLFGTAVGLCFEICPLRSACARSASISGPVLIICRSLYFRTLTPSACIGLASFYHCLCVCVMSWLMSLLCPARPSHFHCDRGTCSRRTAPGSNETGRPLHLHTRPHDRRRALGAIHPLRSLCGR